MAALRVQYNCDFLSDTILLTLSYYYIIPILLYHRGTLLNLEKFFFFQPLFPPTKRFDDFQKVEMRSDLSLNEVSA